MIVVITSWAPTVAFRKPAIAPRTRPRARRDVASRDVAGCALVENASRYVHATLAPIRYWPWPPM
jgi:hypothetical protein